ncbi:MAG: carbohydrate kinase [Bacteroidaceae bacterium]|nr:carbohydrate kinase [Bacteroidaceae bacterium]
MDKRKVIGIGETVYDIIFKGDKPVSAVPGGSTFNAMISLGRCGVNATFLSETGDDHIGDLVCSYLTDNGVSAADVERRGKSPVSLAFLNERNDADYIFYKDHPNDKASMQMPEINEGDVLMFGSYYAINPVIRPKMKAMLEYARQHGAIIYYDLNYRSSHKDEVDTLLPNIEENMRYADIIRGSNEDFHIIYGTDDFDTISAKDCLKGKIVIYTCGAEPTLLKTGGSTEGKEGTRICHSIEPIETVSTIGAGDNYNAGVVFSLIRDNISRNNLSDGMSEEAWRRILSTAQRFSAECCKSIDNTVGWEFARGMADTNNSEQ